MRKFDIAVADRRDTTQWRNRKVSWEDDILPRLLTRVNTSETVLEYHALSKTDKGIIKDKGGFVGGFLTGGRRKATTVAHRSILTFDSDNAPLDFWEKFKSLYSCEAAVYSTHSHLPQAPRLRLIVPLSRDVNTDEYQAITRKMAEAMGIHFFDPITFQVQSIMYWPSTPVDGEFYTRRQKGNLLDPQEILSLYTDPNDVSSWPHHPKDRDLYRSGANRKGDPKDAPGLIGAFCRVFDIHSAIEEFLSDKYEATTDKDRYTFIEGSTAGGAVVYEDEFLYSHHGTDPVHGELCNSFDLVRIHLFGALDFGAKTDKPGALPSFKKMQKFISGLKEVKQETINADFSEPAPQGKDTPDNLDWVEHLTMDLKTGLAETTIPNFELIIDNDPALKGRFYYDEFQDQSYGHLPFPWDSKSSGFRSLIDFDDSGLESYIQKKYKIHHASNIKKAFDNVTYKYKKHPVRDYLDTLKWDGVPRIDDLLVKYMGAEDNIYVKTVMRKSLCACVTRIYKPGTKFDNTLILIGEEGKSKSTLLETLGGEWFSDTFTGVKGKEAMEQLQGVWVMEMAELDGLKRAEITAIKAFLTKTQDRFRAAYGRRTSSHPRQVVFFGTTNEDTPLRGETGNRRFWPVYCSGGDYNKIITIDRDQIWAEAKEYYLKGEILDLPEDVKILAKKEQMRRTESDDRKGAIENYLNTPLPDNWYNMSKHERILYLNGEDDELRKTATLIREKVCPMEVWAELYRGDIKNADPYRIEQIRKTIRSITGWALLPNPCNFSGYGKVRGFYRTKDNPIQTLADLQIEQEIDSIL